MILMEETGITLTTPSLETVARALESAFSRKFCKCVSIYFDHCFGRCGQPAQQQGRLIPLRILSKPTAMRRSLVSASLAEVTQQIHSLRASGVMSSQTALALASAFSA